MNARHVPREDTAGQAQQCVPGRLWDSGDSDRPLIPSPWEDLP